MGKISSLFQSPKSGKFVSNLQQYLSKRRVLKDFNPLDRGNLYQISIEARGFQLEDLWLFQSPRSGKFVSDAQIVMVTYYILYMSSFNPLNRGNLYQILNWNANNTDKIKFQSPRSGKFISNLQVKETFFQRFLSGNLCFNPLDRGNLYQIAQKTIVN